MRTILLEESTHRCCSCIQLTTRGRWTRHRERTRIIETSLRRHSGSDGVLSHRHRSSLSVRVANITISRYPGLRDAGNTVALSHWSRLDFVVLKSLIPPHGDARTGEGLWSELRSLNGLAVSISPWPSSENVDRNHDGALLVDIVSEW